MEQVIKIILEIEKRPSMYIGRNSIFCLRAYLYGMMSPLETNKDKELEFIKRFQVWVENKYNIESSHSWADIIHFFSDNEQDALDNFFIDFKTFLEVSQI